MIKVDVEDYCHDCLSFDADVQHGEKMYKDGFYGPESVVTDTVIRCSYRNRCRSIERYLERKKQKKE